MKKIAVMIADGSEEIESLTPVDVLRRAQVAVDLVSVGGDYVTGSHGIVIKADKRAENADFSEYDGIVVPGGMPGAINIANDQSVINALKEASDKGKLVAAICAAPAVVLAKCGILNGKRVTCYPADAFIAALKGSLYTAKAVERDGNIVTADGPRSAMAFAIEICAYLGEKPKF